MASNVAKGRAGDDAPYQTESIQVEEVWISRNFIRLCVSFGAMHHFQFFL